MKKRQKRFTNFAFSGLFLLPADSWELKSMNEVERFATLTLI
jgi:hypothetical protein